MKTYQIQTADDLLRSWPFLVDGFRDPQVSADPDEMFRVVSSVIANPESGWIGVAEDNFANKLGFVILHDSTALHSAHRLFRIRVLHVPKGRTDVANALLRQFEGWARRSRVNGYTMSLRKSNGAATRYMQAIHRGLKFQSMTYERSLA